MDIIDSLDHIEAKIEFMSDACIGIGKQEDAIGETSAFGMQLVFDEIRNEVGAINKALYENIHNDTVITMEKVSNVG